MVEIVKVIKIDEDEIVNEIYPRMLDYISDAVQDIVEHEYCVWDYDKEFTNEDHERIVKEVCLKIGNKLLNQNE